MSGITGWGNSVHGTLLLFCQATWQLVQLIKSPGLCDLKQKHFIELNETEREKAENHVCPC